MKHRDDSFGMQHDARPVLASDIATLGNWIKPIVAPLSFNEQIDVAYIPGMAARGGGMASLAPSMPSTVAMTYNDMLALERGTRFLRTQEACVWEASVWACSRTSRVSTSLHIVQANVSSAGNPPNFGTVRTSPIVAPQCGQFGA